MQGMGIPRALRCTALGCTALSQVAKERLIQAMGISTNAVNLLTVVLPSGYATEETHVP